MKKIIFNLKATSMVLLFVLTLSTSVSAQQQNVSFDEESNLEAPVPIQPIFESTSTMPTLTSVSIAPTCAGTPTVVTLFGLQPSQPGSATYRISNGPTINLEVGTATPDGTFAFTTPNVPATSNNLILTILSVTNSQGTITFGAGQRTAQFVVNPNPTLGTVTSTSSCLNGTITITLSGLLPNKVGIATYKVGNGSNLSQSGTANASGSYSFTVPATSNVNNLILEVLDITTDGCTKTFINKKTTLKLLPQPTLSTVSAAQICAGTFGNIVLSGLNPNTTGFATYRINNGPLVNQEGTSSAGGTLSFPTNVLSTNQNGANIRITRLTTAAGCFTNFTNKNVIVSVINCFQASRFGGNTGKDGDKNGVAVNSDLKLYPNPAKDVLNIDIDSEVTSVEVLNMQGQRMLTSTEKQINISNLPVGTYVVRVQDAQNNVVVKRVVKN